jgi:hypothetical protein
LIAEKRNLIESVEPYPACAYLPFRSGVGIAVLDSGIYTGHLAFKGKDGQSRVWK